MVIGFTPFVNATFVNAGLVNVSLVYVTSVNVSRGRPGRNTDWTAENRPSGQAIVNALDRDFSAASEFLGNRLDQAGIHRLDRGREHGGDAAVAPDQVFVEVPARHFEGTLGSGPLVERMRVRAAHLGLGGERKAHAVLIMRGRHDLD